MSDLVRFGLIASSRVARRRFLPALMRAENARLVRIGSRDLAKADGLAAAFGGVRTGSYEDVLADPDVDVVYISTPPAFHEAWVRKAAAAGKHILCEKPAFTSYRAAVEMTDFCGCRGVRLMEGYMFRHHPRHALVSSLFSRLGSPRVVQAEWTFPQPPPDDFRLQPDLGGGVFFDAGGYPLAAALLHINSAPVTVSSEAVTDATTGVERAVSFQIQFAGGELAQGLVAYGLRYRARYTVLCAQGWVEVERAFAIEPDAVSVVTLETETGVERIAVESADQFRLMIEAFAAQISGAATRHDFEGELVRQHRLMDAIRRAFLERRVVSLDENFLSSSPGDRDRSNLPSD